MKMTANLDFMKRTVNLDFKYLGSGRYALYINGELYREYESFLNLPVPPNALNMFNDCYTLTRLPQKE